MLKEKIFAFLSFTIENIFILGTIIFAGYVSWHATSRKIDINILLSWILIILCLIAISQFIERHIKLRKILNTTLSINENVKSKFGEKQSADQFFFKKLPSIEQDFEKANEIFLSGIVLSRTFREYQNIIATRLKTGAKIKVILLDPNSPAAESIVNPDENLTLKNIKAFAEETVQRINYLSKDPDMKGEIVLKHNTVRPYFNIIAFDPKTQYGKIFVEFYPQKWERGIRPRMELTAKRDPFWFNYFRNQFEKVWEQII